MTHFSRRSVIGGLLGSGLAAGLSPKQVLAQSFDLGFDSGERYQSARRQSNRYGLLSRQVKTATHQAIKAYRKLVYRGGWPKVPNQTYYAGIRHPNVRILRARLWASGDLRVVAGDPMVFDSYVTDAVKMFQSRHGLITDGIVSKATLASLNVSASERLSQLIDNHNALLDRKSLGRGKRVIVNIPAARVEAVEDHKVRSYHAGVVGKPDRQSPEIDVKIVAVNFNPYWTAPKSIIKRDLIPIVLEDPSYLERNKLRISRWDSDEEIDPSTIDWTSDEATSYRFRQDPFEGNSMGSFRINMPNNHAVYMHDTPSKSLFGSDYRFHSSGCVRVQKIQTLVNWLLEDNDNWPRQRQREALRNSKRVDAPLKRSVPVHWVYFTAWAETDGVVQFRDDIYHKYSSEMAQLNDQ